MKRKPRGLSLIERAVIARAVQRDALEAELHALIGGDSDMLVNKSGRIFWIVLGALTTEEVDPDMPEVRVLRGACNAMYEQAGQKTVDPMRRASILAGLEACGRLIGALSQRSLVDAAVEMEVRLRVDAGVDWVHFLDRLEQVAG